MDEHYLCGSPRDSWFYSPPLLVGLEDNATIPEDPTGTEPTLGIRFLHFLARFSQNYQPVHGYVCLVICIFGLFTNVLNFIVLTRSNMRTSINMILAAIALCDTGTMSTYLIYVWHFYVTRHTSPCATYSYGWMNFILFHSLWSILLHSSSIWLVVLLALMRLAVMRRAKVGHAFLKPENVWKLMLYVYTPLGALCIPVIFTHTIHQVNVDGCSTHSIRSTLLNSTNQTIFDTDPAGVGYTVVPSEAALRNDCALLRVVLWINGVCFKLLPCLLLAVSIWGLLRTLREARERNNRVLRRRSDAHKCKYFHSRTTKMLVAILSIFLVTELPQALVATLSGLNPHDIYFKIYPSLGDLLDLLSLANSGINFLLYCGMSSRFRTTFLDLFAPKPLRIVLRRRRRGFSISDNEAGVYGVTGGGVEEFSFAARVELLRRASGPVSYGTGSLLRSTLANAAVPIAGRGHSRSPVTTREESNEMQSMGAKPDSVTCKRRSTMSTLLSCDSSSAGSTPVQRGAANRAMSSKFY